MKPVRIVIHKKVGFERLCLRFQSSQINFRKRWKKRVIGPASEADFLNFLGRILKEKGTCVVNLDAKV